jgi:hypothetical protein
MSFMFMPGNWTSGTPSAFTSMNAEVFGKNLRAVCA